MQSSAGGGVRAAAPELCRTGVCAGSAEGADGGDVEVRRPDAGAVTELQAARGCPVHGPWRGCRAEDAPPQQEGPGGRTSS